MTELPKDNTIVAKRVTDEIALNARVPAHEWQSAEPIHFDTDWRGKNADPALETEVRALWSEEMLYLRFVCRYKQILVFDDSEASGRRDCLWERDVAEAFLQPPDLLAKMQQNVENPRGRYRAFYKEFEIAPNGMWIDLDISPAGLANLNSGLTRSLHLDAKKKVWVAELAIPMPALTSIFDPALPWRVNFYRVEGTSEPRKYLAWQPTGTQEPDFHVPEAFGWLVFGA